MTKLKPSRMVALLAASFCLLAGPGQSADIKVKALPEGMTLKFVDPAKILDESDKWEKLYKDIITNQAR